MKRIFYGWYMVGAGCAMQFVQSTLLLQSFGAYFAVLRDDRGWSKTELSGAAALHQVEAAILGPLLVVDESETDLEKRGTSDGGRIIDRHERRYEGTGNGFVMGGGNPKIKNDWRSMKKNKKEIVKRQAKAKEKSRKKHQIRLVKPPPRFMERPPISQMEAPKGFMAISSSQALMEYAKPLMEKNAESLDELNRRMELASSLWNLAISRQKDEQQEYSHWMERVKASAKKVLNLEGAERDRYIAEMIERQVHLFPEEVQPAPPSMFMYMRKDVSYLIPPFDHGRIRFRVDTTIPPDEEDLRLIGKIEALDDRIRRGSDYDAYEELALSIEDESKTCFKKWLIAKGFEDDPEQYAHCPEIYLTFLYRYVHDDPVLLKSVPGQYLIEFFEDFLLRKVMCKPSEYLYWPPSLKLFYRFLNEKGYLSSKETAILLGSLDAMEPHFLEILQKRYH